MYGLESTFNADLSHNDAVLYEGNSLADISIRMKKVKRDVPLISQQDMQSLHSKIAELAEQNTYLVKEVQSLRETVAVLKGGNEQH